MHIRKSAMILCGIMLFSMMPFKGICSLDSLRQLYQKATTRAEKSQVLGKLAFELSKTNPDSALFLARRGLVLGAEGASDQGISDCLNAAGWSYFILGRNDSAILYLDSAVHLFHRIKATSSEARSLLNLSSIYNSQQHYEQSLACLLPARKMLEEGDDENAKAYAELQIGIVYRQQGHYPKALAYLKSSIADFKKAGARAYTADALSSLGGLYIYLNDPDSSLLCYRQSLAINKSLGNLYGTAFAYENLGDAYLKKAEYTNRQLMLDSSLHCYQNSMRIFSSINDANDSVYERFNIGRVNRRMKNYGPAAGALEASLHYFDSTSAVVNAFNATQELAFLYKEQKNYEEALRYTEMSQHYKDTLDARNRSGDMAEMLARYETERKDQTIRLLNTQQLLDRQQITRDRVVLAFSGALLLLGAALAFLAFSRNRIRRQLHDVNLRNQLARDLHDDIGSSLSSIMLLSKMGNAAGMAGAAMQQSIIEKIDLTSRDIMDRMSDIVWSMNPKYDKFINLKEKIETHLADVREFSEITTQINISEEIAGLKLPMELRKNLYLIVKEGVNNVLKYAQAGYLLICIFKQGDHLCMTIKDDGTGFDPSATREGNGMDTMVQRAANSHGSCVIHSAAGEGTEIVIRVPLPRIRQTAS